MKFIDRALIDAVWQSNKLKANMALMAGGNINVRMGLGSEDLGSHLDTLLHIALKRNDTALVHRIISIDGVDLTLIGENGYTPAHIAAMQETAENLKGLIRSGVDVNAQDSNGNTPSHIALLHDNKEALSAIINGKADLSIKNNDGLTVAHLAVLNGNIDTLKLLVETDAYLGVKDNEGRTPLDLSYDHRDLVENIESVTNYLESVQAESGYIQDLKAMPIRDAAGVSILYNQFLHARNAVIVPSNDRHQADLVLKRGDIDINMRNRIPDNYPDTELDALIHTAAKSPEYPSMLKWVLSKDGVDVNLKGDYGYTALHIAAGIGSNQHLQDHLDENNGQLQHYYEGPRKFNYAIDLLIRNNADLNIQDDFGQTPAHIAVRSGDSRSLSALVGAHAHLNVKDNDNKTALDLAYDNNNEQMIYQLKLHGAMQSNQAKQLDTSEQDTVKPVTSIADSVSTFRSNREKPGNINNEMTPRPS